MNRTFAMFLLLVCAVYASAKTDFEIFQENYLKSQTLVPTRSNLSSLKNSYSSSVFNFTTGASVATFGKTDHAKHESYWTHIYNLASLYAYAEHYPSAAGALTAYTGKADILNLLVKSVNWYFDNDKECTQEYHQTYTYHESAIIPLMDFTLATLYKHIHTNPSADLKKAADAMLAFADYQLDSGKQTKGPNWSFRVNNHCFRHVYVSNDPARMERLRTAIARGLTYTLMEETGESDGFYPDGMVFHHGEMCYFTMYGKEMVDKHIEMHHFLQNTKWKFTDDEWNTIAFLYWEGVRHAIYRGNPDYSTAPKRASELAPRIEWSSRQAHLNVQDILKYSEGKTRYDAQFRTWLQNYDTIPEPQERDQYLTELDEHRYFWIGDYQVHRRNEYYIATRRSSLRARAPEDAGTNDGHMHLHYGSGYTPILVRGDEYRVARIGWNWLALPGTTNEMCGTEASGKAGSMIRNNTTFSGGLEDGKYGVGAFVYAVGEPKNNVWKPVNGATAQKSNFYFDEGMLCIGTKIGRQGTVNNQKADIVTTLDQKRSETDMYYSIDGAAEATMTKTTAAEVKKSVTNKAWFWHSGVGYVVYTNGKTALNVEAKVSFNTLNPVLKNEKEGWQQVYEPGLTAAERSAGKIWMWHLFVNHGEDPSNAYYSYMVLPNVTKEETAAYCNDPKFTIEVMDNFQHIVYHKETDMYQAVFFLDSQANLKNGGSIKVDDPMIVQIRRGKDGNVITTAQNVRSYSYRTGNVSNLIAPNEYVGNKYTTSQTVQYQNLPNFSDKSIEVQFETERNYEGKPISTTYADDFTDDYEGDDEDGTSDNNLIVNGDFSDNTNSVVWTGMNFKEMPRVKFPNEVDNANNSPLADNVTTGVWYKMARERKFVRALYTTNQEAILQINEKGEDYYSAMEQYLTQPLLKDKTYRLSFKAALSENNVATPHAETSYSKLEYFNLPIYASLILEDGSALRTQFDLTSNSLTEYTCDFNLAEWAAFTAGYSGKITCRIELPGAAVLSVPRPDIPTKFNIAQVLLDDVKLVDSSASSVEGTEIANEIQCISMRGAVQLRGELAGKTAHFYTTSGVRVHSEALNSNVATVSLPHAGVYLLRVHTEVYKIFVK